MTALRSKIQATWVLVMAAVALAGAGQAAESQSVTASSVEVPAAAFRLASGAMRPMQVDPAAEVLARLAASDAGQDAYLELARSYREALQPLEARTVLERASALFASPEVALEAARFFLAMGWTDRAWRVLDGAREDHPSDLGLLEAAAAVALASQRPEEAVTLLREAWAGGADRLAWLDDPLFANWRTQAPLRSMIDAELLASSLDGLDTGAQLDRLSVLAEVVTPGAAQAIVDVILTTDQPRVVRAGLWALARLGAAAEPAFAALLDRGDAWVRLETLRTIRTSGLETFATLLEQELEVEREAASFDLAQLALAELEARRGAVEAAERVLRGLPEANRYRHLALATLAGRYRIAGRDRAAAAVDAEAVELRRAKADLGKELDPVLERYHECKFRQDIAEVRQLLEHHKYVERIDARLYGLPEDDFDDQKSISIAERLMLRQIGEDEGWDMPVTGPIQYPREIPHFLRRYYAEHGTLPDCAAILEGWDEPEAVTLDWETKPNNDSSDDNETNIVVNPMDDRYVVGTANPSVGSANEVYRSSNYGATWTYDTVTPAGSYACDPVSYYSRIGSTDYLYHSFLTDCGSLCEVHMDYSVDNGDTWTACADVESTGNYDRQDHAIDLDPWGASSCANTVYVGYHSGTQYVRASSGSSAPYCQSWKSRGSGLSSTIGSAIVVATTGRAFNFYNQYSSGVKAMYTDNCGTSWGSSSSVADYNYDNFDWGIPSTCERTVYHYVQGDNDRVQGSPFRNRIYLTWNDLNTACSPPGCNGNTTCNDDVFVAVGTPDNPDSPTSWSWNTYNITDALTDDYTDEFYPSISVDQADGAVYLSYYRTNSGAGGIAPRRDEVHYVILRSVTGADSAAEWELLQVTAQPTCEAQGCGGNTWMQWGDYTWNDAVNGVAYAIWTDRRENADEDNWVGRVRTRQLAHDPGHRLRRPRRRHRGHHVGRPRHRQLRRHRYGLGRRRREPVAAQVRAVAGREPGGGRHLVGLLRAQPRPGRRRRPHLLHPGRQLLRCGQGLGPSGVRGWRWGERRPRGEEDRRRVLRPARKPCDLQHQGRQQGAERRLGGDRDRPLPGGNRGSHLVVQRLCRRQLYARRRRQH